MKRDAVFRLVFIVFLGILLLNGLGNLTPRSIVKAASDEAYFTVTIYTYDTTSGDYTFKLELNADNTPAEFWRYVRPDFSDVYVTRETATNETPVYYWIESYDVVNREATIWIRDTDYVNGSTYRIHFYLDNPYSSYNDPNNIFLFYDDFDVQSFNVVSGSWSVIDGVAVGSATGENLAYFDTTTSNNIVIEARLAATTTDSSTGIVFAYTDQDNYYMARINMERNTVETYVKNAGEWTMLASQSITLSSNTWYVIRTEWAGNTITVKLYDTNNNLLTTVSATDSTFTTGKNGMRTYNPGKYDWIRVYKPVDYSYDVGSVVFNVVLPSGEYSGRQYLDTYLVPGMLNEVVYYPENDTFTVKHYSLPDVLVDYDVNGGGELLVSAHYDPNYYLWGYTDSYAYNFYVYDAPGDDLYEMRAAGWFDVNGGEARIYLQSSFYYAGLSVAEAGALVYNPDYDGDGHGKLVVYSDQNTYATVTASDLINWQYGTEYYDDLVFAAVSTSQSMDGDLGRNKATVIYLRFNTPGVEYDSASIQYFADTNTYSLDPYASIIKIDAYYKPNRVKATLILDYVYNHTEAPSTDPEPQYETSYAENVYGGDLIPLIIVLVFSLLLSFFIGEKALYISIPIIVYYARTGVISAWIGIIVMLALYLFIMWRLGLLKFGGGEE